MLLIITLFTFFPVTTKLILSHYSRICCSNFEDFAILLFYYNNRAFLMFFSLYSQFVYFLKSAMKPGSKLSRQMMDLLTTGNYLSEVSTMQKFTILWRKSSSICMKLFIIQKEVNRMNFLVKLFRHRYWDYFYLQLSKSLPTLSVKQVTLDSLYI